MTAKEYILQQVDKLTTMFDGIELRYAYDQMSNFHIIEVTPESIRRGNEDFVNQEYEIDKEFSELFPDEDLLITEPNALTVSVPTEYTTRRDIIDLEDEEIQHNFKINLLLQNVYNFDNIYLLAA